MKALLKYLLIGFIFISECKIRQSSVESETLQSKEIKEGIFEKKNKNFLSDDGIFTLVTWNIKEFPIEDGETISKVKEVILKYEFDLVAVQEIKEIESFYKLVNDLKEYTGIFSTQYLNDNKMLRTGVIYRKDIILHKNSKLLFEDDTYLFPRAPLEVQLVYSSSSGQYFDWTLIVVHLKAGAGGEDAKRRKEALKKLKNYIDSRMFSEPDDDFIIAGDFNDEINDPVEENVFQIFLDDDKNYKFLTFEVVKAGDFSYPYYGGRLLDHILVTTDTLGEYNEGKTKVYKLDEEIEDYFKIVSDHRPVASYFNVPLH